MHNTRNPASGIIFRFPEIQGNIGEFLLCILFHFMLPILPIAIELAIEGSINPKTVFLFLSVYPLNIGISSRSRFLFGFAVVVSFSCATFFGIASAPVAISKIVRSIGLLAVTSIAGLHLMERYNRHIGEAGALL